MVKLVGIEVGTDVSIDKIYLSIFDPAIAILEVHLVLSAGFNFTSQKYNTRLKGFQDLKVMKRLFIRCDNLFCHAQ
jgi:hypothetical protein